MTGKPTSDEIILACAHLMQVVNRRAELAESANTTLLAACKGLVEYRRRAGALNFQLEKADDYIRMMKSAIDILEGCKSSE